MSGDKPDVAEFREMIADAITFGVGAFTEATMGIRPAPDVAAFADEFIDAYIPARTLTTRLAAVEAAHARDLAALRERAEVAEAKVAAVWDEAVQALAWAMDNGPDPLRYVAENNPYRALADRPAGGES